MSKILFLTSRNVVNDSGEVTGVGAATLIYRRAIEMYKTLGMTTYIIPINGRVTTSSTGFKGVYFVHKKSTIKETIRDFIINEKPNVVIYSGDKSYFYESYIRQLTNKLSLKVTSYIDLHGALEEGIENYKGTKWIKYLIRFVIKKILFKQMAKKVDGAFLVSDEMKEHYSKLLPKHVKLFDNTLKIRCGVNNLVSDTQKLEWRKEIRDKWGVNDDTIVFVYSGFRAAWQCIDEIIVNFSEIDVNHKDVFFVFLTVSDEKFEEKLRKIFPKKNYFVGLVSKSDLFKYLVACDVGMLIRQNDYTNKVAFPNKFSDYLNAGLFLTISESLSEPVRLLKEYNIPHTLLNPGEEYISDLKLIKERQNDLFSFYAKTNLLVREELLYSKQILNQKEKFSAFIQDE